jgi:hypothetical protein
LGLHWVYREAMVTTARESAASARLGNKKS